MTAQHVLEDVGDATFGLIRTANDLGMIVPALELGKPARGTWRFDDGAARFQLITRPDSLDPAERAELLISRLPRPTLSAAAADLDVAFAGTPAEVIAVVIIALFQAVRDGNLPPA